MLTETHQSTSKAHINLFILRVHLYLFCLVSPFFSFCLCLAVATPGFVLALYICVTRADGGRNWQRAENQKGALGGDALFCIPFLLFPHRPDYTGH